MIYFKRSSCSKWLTRAIKDRLFVDVDNEIVCDGYSLFKIDDNFKKSLMAKGLYFNLSIQYGVGSQDVKKDLKMINDIWNQKLAKKEIKDTKFMEESVNYVNRVFVGEEHTTMIAIRFHEMLHRPSQYYTFKNDNPICKVDVYEDDKRIALVLPVRPGNNNYHVVKKGGKDE